MNPNGFFFCFRNWRAGCDEGPRGFAQCPVACDDGALFMSRPAQLRLLVVISGHRTHKDNNAVSDIFPSVVVCSKSSCEYDLDPGLSLLLFLMVFLHSFTRRIRIAISATQSTIIRPKIISVMRRIRSKIEVNVDHIPQLYPLLRRNKDSEFPYSI